MNERLEISDFKIGITKYKRSSVNEQTGLNILEWISNKNILLPKNCIVAFTLKVVLKEKVIEEIQKVHDINIIISRTQSWACDKFGGRNMIKKEIFSYNPCLEMNFLLIPYFQNGMHFQKMYLAFGKEIGILESYLTTVFLEYDLGNIQMDLIRLKHPSRKQVGVPYSLVHEYQKAQDMEVLPSIAGLSFAEKEAAYRILCMKKLHSKMYVFDNATVEALYRCQTNRLEMLQNGR